MKIVRMLHSAAGNAAGEVCGHADDLAEKLVKQGVAVYVTATPPPAVTKEAPSATSAPAPAAPATPPAVEEKKGLGKKG